MSLLPNLNDRIARARTDLRLGLPVVLRDGQHTALVFAAEGLDDERLSEAREFGPLEMVVTSWRARTLQIRVYDGDIARIEVPEDATALWVSCIADPKDDLRHAMKGPFKPVRGGSTIIQETAVNLIKSAWLLPAAITIFTDRNLPDGLTILDAQETHEALDAPVAHRNVVSGRVPMQVSEAGRVHVFRPDTGGEEHFVCEIGRPDREKPVLVRLHSACFTGDVLGSLKCDCGPQLAAALGKMGSDGSGVLLYLNQEGRGIGLANKMRAYSLQDQGFDTVEANHRLGFEDDERDFRTGADLLRRLGIKKIRLLTNNPAKVAMMEAQGVEVVERVPLKVGLNPLNERYLDVKAKKSGHIL
ncbi:MAG: GTP cyclohydrolase II [Boseongicola sp.]|nr:GTP cyclohydrolase II [Boseongicola sp.]MDD9979682.1 GTP cyclohydrolase II [Boseongicola sp.]